MEPILGKFHIPNLHVVALGLTDRSSHYQAPGQAPRGRTRSQLER